MAVLAPGDRLLGGCANPRPPAPHNDPTILPSTAKATSSKPSASEEAESAAPTFPIDDLDSAGNPPPSNSLPPADDPHSADDQLSTDGQPSTDDNPPSTAPSASSSDGDCYPPPVVSPPYWQLSQPSRGRATSAASQASTINTSVAGRPGRILLEDNTSPLPLGVRSPLWARVVRIPEYAVVAGTIRGVGDYVVWLCHVDTLDGGTIVLRKRYSEFETLRAELALTFRATGPSLPVLPPKSVLYKFRAAFLEKRRRGLEYFLK